MLYYTCLYWVVNYTVDAYKRTNIVILFVLLLLVLLHTILVAERVKKIRIFVLRSIIFFKSIIDSEMAE